MLFQTLTQSFRSLQYDDVLFPKCLAEVNTLLTDTRQLLYNNR